MSSGKPSVEDRLRLCPSMQVLAETMRECLKSGTLGKHMPRYFVPQQRMADAPAEMMNVLSLEGIKDDKALFEIRRHHASLRNGGNPLEFIRYRHEKQAPFVDKPWLRALVPLKGPVAGTVIQLRQPPTFRSAYVGFIHNRKVERRGVFSRHTEFHDVGNGAVDSCVPVIRVVRENRRHSDVAVPVDNFLTVRLRHTHDGRFEPHATAGVLVPTPTLSALRVERRQMRDAAHEYLSRVSAAVAVMDLSSGGVVDTANALQDILGLNRLMPDYHFKSELEMASGRWQHTHGPLYEAEFSTAVLAGAMHAGARTEFYSDDDAKTFIIAARSFASILRNKQDKVFQANTIFSSTPSPDEPDEYAQLHTIANGDIKPI